MDTEAWSGVTACQKGRAHPQLVHRGLVRVQRVYEVAGERVMQADLPGVRAQRQRREIAHESAGPVGGRLLVPDAAHLPTATGWTGSEICFSANVLSLQ